MTPLMMTEFWNNPWSLLEMNLHFPGNLSGCWIGISLAGQNGISPTHIPVIVIAFYCHSGWIYKEWEIERERETFICKFCIESTVQRLVICIQGWEAKIRVCWRWHCPIDSQSALTRRRNAREWKCRRWGCSNRGVYKRKWWSCKSLTSSNIPAQLCKHRHLKHSVNSFHGKKKSWTMCQGWHVRQRRCLNAFFDENGGGWGGKVLWANDTGGIMSSRVWSWEQTHFFKGLVRPEMKTLSSFIDVRVVPKPHDVCSSVKH